jgi:hypothetical protein
VIENIDFKGEMTDKNGAHSRTGTEVQKIGLLNSVVSPVRGSAVRNTFASKAD